MKKRILAAVCTVAMAVGMLTGCGGKKVTVTFMNGSETLGTAETSAGKTLTADSYREYEQSDDAEFEGWYETPTFLESSRKDLTTDTFSEDTTLYANFEIANSTEDTRRWYIAGASSKGILADNGWAGSLSDEEKEAYELKPTGNFNEFALTLDLYEGDEFQILADWSWDEQKGFGLFTDIDETQMENGGGLSGDDAKSNVKVLMDGNYTITLLTYPDNPVQDTLAIVRNSDPVE